MGGASRGGGGIGPGSSPEDLHGDGSVIAVPRWGCAAPAIVKVGCSHAILAWAPSCTAASRGAGRNSARPACCSQGSANSLSIVCERFAVILLTLDADVAARRQDAAAPQRLVQRRIFAGAANVGAAVPLPPSIAAMVRSTVWPKVDSRSSAFRVAHRASCRFRKRFSAMYSSRPSSASSRYSASIPAQRSSKASEMYFRKMRPGTACLCSAASIEPRSASALAHSSDS